MTHESGFRRFRESFFIELSKGFRIFSINIFLIRSIGIWKLKHTNSWNKGLQLHL